MTGAIGKTLYDKSHFIRKCEAYLRRTPLLSPIRIDQNVAAENEVGQGIENLQVLWPAEKVSFEPT